jgi:endo-1,4-beta-xylanase
MDYNRREFISLAGIALSLPVVSPVLAEVSGEVKCLVYDADGTPLPTDSISLERFHLCDLSMRPFTVDFETSPGEIRFTPPTERPFRISVPLTVPGFGEVFVYADDCGAGYTASTLGKVNPLLLNYAFARDRMATVRKLEEDCKQLGVVITPEVQHRIDSAQASLKRADAAGSDRSAQVHASMESLRDSLWAAELLSLARARTVIERSSARTGFLFGCNGFGLAAGYPDSLNQFSAVFNYTTIPIYEAWVEPRKGYPD